jgi:oligosaccharide repeat unit polymerase
MKLLKYIDLSEFTWFVIVYAFFAFFAGTITLVAARANFPDREIRLQTPIVMSSNGESFLKITIILFSVLGLLSAFQHWSLLLHKFGSIKSILFNANAVYRLNVENKLPGVIPYVHISGYVAVFLAGIYTAIKRKLTLVAVFPLIAVIIKELAIFGRVGILMSFLIFVMTFFLFKYFLDDVRPNINSHGGKKNIVIAGLVIVILFVGGITLVKSFRGSKDSFKATDQAFKQYNENVVISPAIYLYISSHIGVLNQYFEKGTETAIIGENSLQPIYNLLSKFDIVKHPDFFQRGYNIPMWTNTGTYIREIHADYGDVGLLIFPYFFGMICTYFWFKFYESGSMLSFVVLVYLYLVVALSFFVIITRAATWFLSFAFLLIFMPLFERMILRINRKKNSAGQESYGEI